MLISMANACVFPKGLCKQLVQGNGAERILLSAHAILNAMSVSVATTWFLFPPTAHRLYAISIMAGATPLSKDFQNFRQTHVRVAVITSCRRNPVRARWICRSTNAISIWCTAISSTTTNRFMGSVTAPERAQDTVDMAKNLFGDNFVDPETGSERTVVTSLINANSPLGLGRHHAGCAESVLRATIKPLLSLHFVLQVPCRRSQ